MEQIRQFQIAQEFIDKLTNTSQEDRHSAQEEAVARYAWPNENRAQRRERERRERRAAKKVSTR